MRLLQPAGVVRLDQAGRLGLFPFMSATLCKWFEPLIDLLLSARERVKR